MPLKKNDEKIVALAKEKDELQKLGLSRILLKQWQYSKNCHRHDEVGHICIFDFESLITKLLLFEIVTHETRKNFFRQISEHQKVI